jgi:hypothetical protein
MTKSNSTLIPTLANYLYGSLIWKIPQKVLDWKGSSQASGPPHGIPLVLFLFVYLVHCCSPVLIYDPQATCTCDGKIVIWNMASEPPSIEKSLEGIIPVVIDTEWVVYLLSNLGPEFLS